MSPSNRILISHNYVHIIWPYYVAILYEPYSMSYHGIFLRNAVRQIIYDAGGIFPKKEKNENQKHTAKFRIIKREKKNQEGKEANKVLFKVFYYQENFVNLDVQNFQARPTDGHW